MTDGMNSMTYVCKRSRKIRPLDRELEVTIVNLSMSSMVIKSMFNRQANYLRSLKKTKQMLTC